MAFQETVTLVNRTTGKNKRTLTCTFDGLSVNIEPGENHGFPKEAVAYAKAQNPVKGTMDPYNPFRYQSLVGVKGVDPCDPVVESKNDELIDRKKMRGIGKTATRVMGDPASAFEARVQGNIDGVDAAQHD